jgi:RNA polymerase sigma-70 factor (ECF subfamily)
MVSQLVERIRQKDQRAMSQLYQMYVKELSSVCYRYVSSKNDAKDVLQNSFVKIFTLIPTIDYHSEEAFWGWMKKVVVNESLNYLREKRKLLFVMQDMAHLPISDDEEPKTEQITSDELHQIISTLPDGYRTVVNLYAFEGYSHKKIAKLLGIEESTSASQLYFAKRLLARKIKDLMKERQ